MVLVHVAPSFSTFFSLGVVAVGMASWLGGSDEAEMDEPVEDDEFAMDDDFGMDDLDDDFGGMEEGSPAGSADTTELENRIEDLESEIANVSSTANTVRSENEQISETVEDVEENVRKLLEIYEMVTRGVNPFVDDVSTDAGLGGDGGSFGLFDDEDDTVEDAADDDLDEDIADAEAEDFFDDDAFDDFDDEFDEETSGDEFDDPADEFDEMDAFEDGDDDLDEMADDDLDAMADEPPEENADDTITEDQPMDESTDDGGGGTSFEELKAEYESGEADWADEDLEADDETETEAEPAGEDDEAEDLFIEDDLTEGADVVEGLSEDDEDGGESDDETLDPPTGEVETAESEPDTDVGDDAIGSAAAPEPDPTQSTAATASEQDRQAREAGDADTGGFQFGAAAATADGEPHLERPPNGYLADLVVLEWLEYLVDAYDARNAVRAINYYERIGWIGEPMRDHCVEVLYGITDADYVYRDEFGSTDVTMADHRRSLQYVEELSGGHLDRSFADRFESLDTDGI